MLKDPTNPNHHNYVTVNKYQRKKEQSKNINVLVIFKNKQSTFDDTQNYRNLYDYDSIFYRHFMYHYYSKRLKDYHNYDANYDKYLSSPNCKIVWDDVNHTSYRVIKDGKFIKEGKYGKIKHFKRI